MLRNKLEHKQPLKKDLARHEGHTFNLSTGEASRVKWDCLKNINKNRNPKLTWLILNSAKTE